MSATTRMSPASAGLQRTGIKSNVIFPGLLNMVIFNSWFSPGDAGLPSG